MVRGWSKWIGAMIGFALLGHFGGFIGFIVGILIDNYRNSSAWDENYQGESYAHKFDRSQNYKTNSTYQRSATQDFAYNLLKLTAAVMKADGKVLKAELNYVKEFYIRHFGVEETKEYMPILRDLLKQNLNLRQVSFQIAQRTNYNSRLQMLNYLFGIANSDQYISKAEVNVIHQIAGFLGITPTDFEKIKTSFVQYIHNDYKIIGVPTNASNEEIKRAYRNLAMKYHPDRVARLGQEAREKAEKKFQEIQSAYESIKKERRFA